MCKPVPQGIVGQDTPHGCSERVGRPWLHQQTCLTIHDRIHQANNTCSYCGNTHGGRLDHNSTKAFPITRQTEDIRYGQYSLGFICEAHIMHARF